MQFDQYKNRTKHINWLRAEIASTDKEIDDYIAEHTDLSEDMDLLCIISGVGKQTSLAIMKIISTVV